MIVASRGWAPEYIDRLSIADGLNAPFAGRLPLDPHVEPLTPVMSMPLAAIASVTRVAMSTCCLRG